MDATVAERLAAGLTPAERTARALELNAEIATSAIPPRLDAAASLRERAAALRQGAGSNGTASDVEDVAPWAGSLDNSWR